MRNPTIIIFIRLIFCSSDSETFLLPKENWKPTLDGPSDRIFSKIQDLCKKIIEKKERNYDLSLENGFLVFTSNIDYFIEKSRQIQDVLHGSFQNCNFFLLMVQIDVNLSDNDLFHFLKKIICDCNKKILNLKRKIPNEKKSFKSIKYKKIKEYVSYLFIFESVQSSHELFKYIENVQDSNKFFTQKNRKYFCFLFKEAITSYDRFIINRSISALELRKLVGNTVVYFSMAKNQSANHNYSEIFEKNSAKSLEINGYFLSLSGHPEKNLHLRYPEFHSAIILTKKNLRKDCSDESYKLEKIPYNYKFPTLDDLFCIFHSYKLNRNFITDFWIRMKIKFAPKSSPNSSIKTYTKIFFVELLWGTMEENRVEIEFFYNSKNTLKLIRFIQTYDFISCECKYYRKEEDIETIFGSILQRI